MKIKDLLVISFNLFRNKKLLFLRYFLIVVLIVVLTFLGPIVGSYQEFQSTRQSISYQNDLYTISGMQLDNLDNSFFGQYEIDLISLGFSTVNIISQVNSPVISEDQSSRTWKIFIMSETELINRFGNNAPIVPKEQESTVKLNYHITNSTTNLVETHSTAFNAYQSEVPVRYYAHSLYSNNPGILDYEVTPLLFLSISHLKEYFQGSNQFTILNQINLEFDQSIQGFGLQATLNNIEQQISDLNTYHIKKGRQFAVVENNITERLLAIEGQTQNGSLFVFYLPILLLGLFVIHHRFMLALFISLRKELQQFRQKGMRHGKIDDIKTIYVKFIPLLLGLTMALLITGIYILRITFSTQFLLGSVLIPLIYIVVFFQISSQQLHLENILNEENNDDGEFFSNKLDFNIILIFILMILLVTILSFLFIGGIISYFLGFLGSTILLVTVFIMILRQFTGKIIILWDSYWKKLSSKILSKEGWVLISLFFLIISTIALIDTSYSGLSQRSTSFESSYPDLVISDLQLNTDYIERTQAEYEKIDLNYLNLSEMPLQSSLDRSPTFVIVAIDPSSYLRRFNIDASTLGIDPQYFVDNLSSGFAFTSPELYHYYPTTVNNSTIVSQINSKSQHFDVRNQVQNLPGIDELVHGDFIHSSDIETLGYVVISNKFYNVSQFQLESLIIDTPTDKFGIPTNIDNIRSEYSGSLIITRDIDENFANRIVLINFQISVLNHYLGIITMATVLTLVELSRRFIDKSDLLFKLGMSKRKIKSDFLKLLLLIFTLTCLFVLVISLLKRFYLFELLPINNNNIQLLNPIVILAYVSTGLGSAVLLRYLEMN